MPHTELITTTLPATAGSIVSDYSAFVAYADDLIADNSQSVESKSECISYLFQLIGADNALVASYCTQISKERQWLKQKEIALNLDYSNLNMLSCLDPFTMGITSPARMKVVIMEAANNNAILTTRYLRPCFQAFLYSGQWHQSASQGASALYAVAWVETGAGASISNGGADDQTVVDGYGLYCGAGGANPGVAYGTTKSCYTPTAGSNPFSGFGTGVNVSYVSAKYSGSNYNPNWFSAPIPVTTYQDAAQLNYTFNHATSNLVDSNPGLYNLDISFQFAT